MFRFWYRYVFANRTLLETGASEIVWKKKISPDYATYMGLVFEQVCRDYLLAENVKGELPFLFISIGRWWGTDAKARKAIEIDLIASDGTNYLIGECKWRNEPTALAVLKELQGKADAFYTKRNQTWFVIFSKSGFTEGLQEEAERRDDVILIGLDLIV